MLSRQQRQCAKCPWKISTDPYAIPNGYDADKHAALVNTIATPGDLNLAGPLRVMACHESNPSSEKPCVGWLHNQLGDGNNIMLRLKVARGLINANYVLDGEQHPTLEDTLPRDMPERSG